MILRSGTNIIFPQWLAGIAVTTLLMQVGFMGGWTSPALAYLMSPESHIPVSPDEASWVASLMNLGRFFGAIIGAVLGSYFGSKKSIFFTLFPIAAGWLIIALANSVEWMYVARISSGIGLGMTFSTFPLYIGEVSLAEIRGALVSLATFGVPLGQTISSVAGTYLSMSQSAYIYLVMCLVLMIIFYWLPESPHHLIKIKQHEVAKKSINWYRSGRDVDNEFDAVEKFVALDSSCSFTDKLRELQSPAIRRATFQIIALFTFMQICGLNSVIFYMETILQRGNITTITPSLIVIYINVCGIFTSILSIFLIDRFGRRFLLLVSSTGVTISMVGLMSHFMMLGMDVDITKLQWLPVTSMFLFVVAFFLGLMPVPSTVLSETFPANIKCIAACLASLTGAFVSFVSSKTYQPMVDLMGESYVFMTYAICSVIVIPYTIFLMPETKGKSLQQIQDELTKK